MEKSVTATATVTATAAVSHIHSQSIILRPLLIPASLALIHILICAGSQDSTYTGAAQRATEVERTHSTRSREGSTIRAAE